MRISAISDWTTCEAMALTDPRPEARVHVAAWVGTLAHSLLSGVETEPPGRLRFDAVTTTEYSSTVQAHAIATEASRCLEAEGWTIIEMEREVDAGDAIGHLDIFAWHGETHRTAIIDLKTGQSIGAGWLQVGGYLAGNIETDVDWGAILHVPRVAVNKEPKATLEVRPGADLEWAWLTAKSRIDAVLAGATALRSPGQHCGRCEASCPVRT